VYWLSAAASPFLGILVDRLGFNLFFLNLGTLATMAAHAMFAFLPGVTYFPFIAMVLMGLAYSLLVCALWPLVAFIVPEYQLGTAYGIMQAIQNLGLAVISIMTGAIVDHAGYLMLEVFFLMCLCVTLIAGILLYTIDSVSDGPLNKSAWARRRLEEEREEEEQRLAAAKNAPSSAINTRNPLLSRLEAKLPRRVYAFNPLSKSFAAHHGVLK